MRIHVTAAVAVSLALAAACGSDSGSGPVKPGGPSTVTIATAPASSAVVGSSAGTFAVKVVDAGGHAVSGIVVSFSATGSASVLPSSASTDASGLASTQVTLGTAAGSATVRASAAGVGTPVTSTITITPGPVAKVVVSPRSLRFADIGDTVRVTTTAQDQFGNNAGTGAIAYSVVDPSVVSVDQAGLVRALKLGATTSVVSASGGKADTASAKVLALGESICSGLVNPTPMNVGEMQTFTGSQYGCLSGTAAGAEFAITVFNGSTDQFNTQAVSLVGSGVATPPSTNMSPLGTGVLALKSALGRNASIGIASSPAASKLDENFHLRLLAQANRQFKGSFARSRSAFRAGAALRSISGTNGNMAVSQSGIPASAKVGDFITLNVSANTCGGLINHGLRVAAIGTQSIVLTDTLNPSGGFSDVDYQRFATRFDTLVYPLDVGAFGQPSDADNNGKIAIIFTRTVNELVDSTSGYFVGGFFNPRDLFPKKGQTAGDDCPGSNEGEMFYMLAPAPNGIKGVTHTTGFVDSITTGIIAHEFQHLINGSRRFSINKGAEEFEDVWLNEGLSHIAEELLYFRESGFAPRSNLTDSVIRINNRPVYGFFKSDQASNFARFLSYLRAPSSNTLFADDDELETRGATWSFLRYSADHVSMPENSLWQAFDNSVVTGMATLSTVFGFDPMTYVRDWNVANFMDDYTGNSNTRFMHPSWNFRDIYVNTFLNIPVYPLKATGLTNNVAVNYQVRGGSSGYGRMAIAPGKDGLLTFSSGGGLPNSSFQFIVVRTK